MKPEQLANELREDPFRPRRIHLVDGRTFDVPIRNMIAVGIDYVDIGIQAPDEIEGVCETLVTLPPEDVLRVEILEETAQAMAWRM